MRIAGLPPVLQHTLLASLARAEDAFVADRSADRTAVAIVPPAVPAATTQPATSVQMLVALAATDPAADRRRKLAAVADRGLSLLERLHAELAVGTPAPERLRELLDWADTAEAPTDPQLASLQRDIEVRVRVEIAKHDLRV